MFIMSELQQKYSWQRTKANSAKTTIAQAEHEVPHFKEHIAKFDEQENLKTMPKALLPTIFEPKKKHVSSKGRKERSSDTIILINKH